MTAAAVFADSFTGTDPRRRTQPRWQRPALAIPGARLLPQAGRRVTDADVCGTPPGTIGGALVRAARCRIRLSQRGLAQRVAVTKVTVAHWEAGSTPLYCTNFGQLRQLAAALNPAGGDERQLLHELLLASQCDLLLTGMLHGFEDYAEVPPIDEDTADGESVRGLLRWALTGAVPPQYEKHAPAGRLLTQCDVTRIRALAVQAGAQCPDLKVFGCTLARLTKPGSREE